jgi:O-antigen ligase
VGWHADLTLVEYELAVDAHLDARVPDVRLGHAVGALVMASVVAFDPGGWFPFTVAKFTAVGLVLVWCWWVAYDRAATMRLDRRVVWALVVLVCAMAVAATAGSDPLYVWVGTPERSLGVLTWCGFAAAAYAGSRLTAVDRVMVGKWCVAAGLWCGAFAVWERFVGRPVPISVDTNRLAGPYGSAAMFAAALCLIIPICAAVAADRHSVAAWRRAAMFAVAGCSFALVGTGTRASWVGCLVGGAALVVARHRQMLAGRRRLVPLVGAALTGLFVGVVASRGAAGRVTGASGSRLDEWRVGWGIVRSHPLLGVGPEGYRTALADGVSAAYERDYGRDVTPDRAHNVLIDVAAAGGVVALLAYGAALTIVLWGAWRWLRDGRPIEVGIAAAVVAYAAQQMFLFPVATIDPIWWALAGTIVARPVLAGADDSRPWRDRLSFAPKVVAGFVAVVIGVAGVLGVAADRLAKAGVDGSATSAERAVTLRPDVVRYRLLAASAAMRTPTIAGIEAALDHTAAALEVSPNDPIVLLADARYAFDLARSTGAEADVVAALGRWQALAVDANCYQCQLGLGYAAALADDAATARQSFRRAMELAPAGNREAQEALQRLAELSA